MLKLRPTPDNLDQRRHHLRFQLTFDSFTLGKFVSFTAEGCPDGSLQISEAQRPDVGGLWCGTSWGPAIYYSETQTVSITLKLLRLSKDQTGFNFDFRMAYKMIRKSDAVVRYGNPFVGTYESLDYIYSYISSSWQRDSLVFSLLILLP